MSQDTESKKAKSSEGGAKSNGLFAITLFAFGVGAYLSLFVGWIVFPALLYSSEKQPLDFNHAIHLDLVDDGCRSCHYFRDDGSFTGIPPMENCAECHEDMQGENVNEKILIDDYVTPEKEIPWLVYSKQPDCVFFSHSAHVFSDKMVPDEESDTEDLDDEYGAKCQICHGPIGTSESSQVYKKNRITGLSIDIWGRDIMGRRVNTWDRMKMDDCSDCHLKVKKDQLHGRKEACFVCHK